PPAEDASAKVKMAYKLKTVLGKAIYSLRKCTVEPVIGMIKEVLGFRQFWLRGEQAAAGEWDLVCLAFNLKRLHSLLQGEVSHVQPLSSKRRDRYALVGWSEAETAGSLSRKASDLATQSHKRTTMLANGVCMPEVRLFSPTGC